MADKILIIDDDLDTLRLVGLMLQKQGYQIVAASNGPQGLDLALAEAPSIILLDVMMPGMDGYEVAKRLRANERTVDIPILMFTAKSQLDDKVTGFEAGADDYLTKPTHPTELHAHVKALLARSGKAKVNPPTGPVSDQPGYVVGVLAARGGLGVSSVAVNLASALTRQAKTETILAEFRPGQGTLSADLNITRTPGLSDLLALPVLEMTRARVREALFQHPSELTVLTASPHPKDGAQLANIQHFEVLLSRLTFMSKVVVVDLGSGLTPLVQKLVPMFSELLVVAEPFENSLYHSRALLDDLLSLGVEKAKMHVLVNYRMRSEAQLSVPQVQEKIKYAIDITFTPAPELFLQAIRAQTPAIVAQPESLTNQQYAALANKVVSRIPKAAKPQ
ncbi:MAG: response regulator [Anaerolineales bacterium]